MKTLATTTDIQEINWSYDIANTITRFIAKHNQWQTNLIKAGKHNHREFKWLSVKHSQCEMPQCGWKIHISASLLNAPVVLEIVLPILLAYKMNFKVAYNLDFLAFLNNNSTNKKQAGKFITVYITDLEKAYSFAQRLHEATKHLAAPKVITDTPFAQNSIIYYRFGVFITHYVQSLWGGLMQVMTINNKKYYDFKAPNPEFSDQIQNPFTKSPSHHTNQKTTAVIKQNQETISNNRYLECLTINQTNTITVILAIDLISKRRCIIKKADQHCAQDKSGKNAQHRLMIEAEILQKLDHTMATPAYIDEYVDKDGRFCIVMEDITGVNLHEYLIVRVIGQKPIGIKRLLIWSKEIAKIMLTVHDHNIIHADLKLGNLLLSDKSIRLIDFDSACDLENNQVICSCGSTGFTTHNRDRGNKPEINDDIFGYGAVLYYLFGAINPDVNPLEVDQNNINLKQLNPSTPNYIIRLIEGCLSHQFNNFQEIVHFLKTDHKQNRPRETEKPMPVSYHDKLQFLITEYLRKGFNQATNSFDFDHSMFGDVAYNDLRGISGSILALCVATLNNAQPMEPALNQCVDQLLNQKLFYNKIPGLYVGESGKALVLLYRGYLTSNATLIETAKNWQRAANQIPLRSVDLFNGAAGRLRANIIFWILTSDQGFLKAAKNQAQFILKNKVVLNDQGHVGWYNPTVQSTSDDMTLNENEIQLGYAHGMAGIGDALLDYYLITNDPAALSTIQETHHTLIDHSQSNTRTKDLLWPEFVSGPPLLSFWCHGGAGIGTFIARAMRHKIIANDASIIEKITHPIKKFTRSSAPILCHGIAGNLECLLDIQQHFPQIIHKQDIEQIENILSSWLRNYINNDFRTCNAQFDFCGYLTGLSGIISIYTRLSKPTIPNPLHIEFAHYLKGEKQ